MDDRIKELLLNSVRSINFYMSQARMMLEVANLMGYKSLASTIRQEMDNLQPLMERMEKHRNKLLLMMEDPELAAVYEYRADQDIIVRIRDLIKEDKKIEAIKLYRDHTGCSLVKAKQFVDNLDMNDDEGMAV